MKKYQQQHQEAKLANKTLASPPAAPPAVQPEISSSRDHELVDSQPSTPKMQISPFGRKHFPELGVNAADYMTTPATDEQQPPSKPSEVKKESKLVEDKPVSTPQQPEQPAKKKLSRDDFESLAIIGRGAFGEVRLVRRKNSEDKEIYGTRPRPLSPSPELICLTLLFSSSE